MRKNTKRLLLGLVAVAILGGVYAGLMHMPGEQNTSSESKTLVSADADALSSIHVALSGGDDYTLTSTTKNKKTTYTMSGTQDTSAYSDSLMQNLFSTASSISGTVVDEILLGFIKIRSGGQRFHQYRSDYRYRRQNHHPAVWCIQ